MTGFEIVQVMKDIHTIGGLNSYTKEALTEVYQELISKCPKGDSKVLKALKFDLKRVTEYNHELPDLLACITWSKFFEIYEKENNGRSSDEI